MHTEKWKLPVEVALVFAIFFLQGAWPVPEVNEPYYLCKAIHYWNPDWVPEDAFLDSADTHKVFYLTFGWLSLWLSPPVLAWTGRLLTWGLLAWAWQRLSWAVLPRRWASVLSAALFVALLDRFHMAGEWVVGGVEAKGFAFVLVFLGLEALVRNRWNRMWLLFGAASAFHVLVGGWSVVAGGFAWVASRREDRPTLLAMLPALGGGFLLSLPGLLPALAMTRGVDPEVVRQANQIYVFERLYHHLSILAFPRPFVVRFLLMTLAVIALAWATPSDGCLRRLGRFVLGALALAAVGAAIEMVFQNDRATAAELLRFYWYRLSDTAVPLAGALFGVRLLDHLIQTHPRLGKGMLAATIFLAGLHIGGYALVRPMLTVPPGIHARDYSSWRHACRWVAESGQIPSDARFLTPRMSQTFTWYTGRSQVATWKDVPQDPQSIVEWMETMNCIHRTAVTWRHPRGWYDSVAQALEGWDGKQLDRLRTDYGTDYILTVRRPPLDLPVVYENRRYVIYRLPDAGPAE